MIRGVRFLARSAVMAALEISSIDDMLFKGAARWQYSEVGDGKQTDAGRGSQDKRGRSCMRESHI